MKQTKKLIEVALPLDAINKASAREKSIRHGHPSTLHLWWARRPLAAARAVIFAQMVDDPSSHPDIFKTEKAQEKERERLFRIIEELVQWENTTNEEVLGRAREEIWQSWRRTCADNADHPRAKELFDRHKLPAFHDPFAGGGSLPLEAQRLGLEAYASDLNPVAVLINKAMIEIPPKFAGRPPVNPEAQAEIKRSGGWHGKGAAGLAEDVRYYGEWMRDEAEKRIGHLYPKVEITAEMAKDRPDLKPLVGQKLTVIAWLWARTVKSPNPAFANVNVPLASTFVLSTKPGKEAHVEPVIEAGSYRFTVKVGSGKGGGHVSKGTKLTKANFACVMSGAPISADYIKAEGQAGRIGARLMAIVAEGERGRVYLAPTLQHETAARDATPTWLPEGSIATRMTGGNCTPYGLTTWGHLFSARQLVALTTFSDVATEVRDVVRRAGIVAGLNDDAAGLGEGGIGASAYADALAVYLAFAVDKASVYWTSLCPWLNQPKNEIVGNTFGRQAFPMMWDYAEANPFSDSGGNVDKQISYLAATIAMTLSGRTRGAAIQLDAAQQHLSSNKVVSTDPPYYDNIGYADLSDFFYVWLRRALKLVVPEIFTTVAVPKEQELIATRHRHANQEQAEAFFLNGMTDAMRRLADQTHSAFPVTIYYAFKQAETDTVAGTASTGWETFLEAVIRAGFALTGTWPMRTERPTALKTGTNALASSIILVCRPHPADAPSATRRQFVSALKSELPAAVAHLQRGNVAPVDLAQAAIGPGMAIYTRYANVLDAEGKPVNVRDALTLINETLDEVLAEQEGDFDADTRWAITWFDQVGFDIGEYGTAEQLSKSKNTSIAGMVQAGIVASKAGKVRLLKPEELPEDWDPATDKRLTVWEMTHQLIRALEAGGESAAATQVKALGSKAEVARELAYRLYTVCERRKRAAEALSYNALVQSWPEILRLAQEITAPTGPATPDLFS